MRAWVQSQNEHTRAYLDQIPFRARVSEQIRRLRGASSPEYFGLAYVGKKLFAFKRQPPLQQPLLVTLSSADDLSSEEIILDPNQLDPSGGTNIDFFVPSHDARLVAVSLSQKGSEAGGVSIYEVSSGSPLSDSVPRVNNPTAGGSLAWNGDASGFYYTHYPRGDERPAEDRDFYQQVYFHLLGTPSDQDTYVIGSDFPRIAEIQLESSADGRFVLANVLYGDGGEIAHYIRGPLGQWTQVTRFENQVKQALLGQDGYLYMLSRQDAPQGKIIRLPLDNPSLANAETVIAERPGAISAFQPTASRLYIVELDGGPSRLLVFDLSGNEPVEAPSEPVSAIYQLVGLDGDEILYHSGSFLTPPAWYHYRPESGAAERTSLFVTYPADFSDLEVVRDFAVSRDGTRVPCEYYPEKGPGVERAEPHPADRLRRIRHQPAANFIDPQPGLVRCRRRVRGRQPARRG